MTFLNLFFLCLFSAHSASESTLTCSLPTSSFVLLQNLVQCRAFGWSSNKNFNAECKKKQIVLNAVLLHTPWRALCWAGKVQQFWLRCSAEARTTSSGITATKIPPSVAIIGQLNCSAKTFLLLWHHQGDVYFQSLWVASWFSKQQTPENRTYFSKASIFKMFFKWKENLALKKIHWWHWIHNGIRLFFIAHTVKSIRYGFGHVR